MNLIESMTKELLITMYEEHRQLMDSIQKIIWDESKTDQHNLYYTSMTHHYIYEHGWELLFPVPEAEWFRTLNVNNYHQEMPWPQYAVYQYAMDVAFPPEIPHDSLHFGYAIMEDGLVIKTCFFTWMKIVDYQVMPQGIVMDPLAMMHKKSVKYYVGVPVDKEDIQNFVLKIPGHPLENYVKRKSEEAHQKRLYDSNMESYWLQMTYEPHYLPRALQEFAKKEGLHFPADQRSDM